MRIRPCVVCGSQNKSGSFWLCKPCAVAWDCYKRPFSEWPEWVKELKRMANRQEYQRNRRGEPIPVDPVILERLLGTTNCKKVLGIIVATEFRYQEVPYYQSSAWFTTRDIILQRDNYKCQRCGSINGLQVHHLTYKRFRRELPDDLITLCRECHEKEHGIAS